MLKHWKRNTGQKGTGHRSIATIRIRAFIPKAIISSTLSTDPGYVFGLVIEEKELEKNNFLELSNEIDTLFQKLNSSDYVYDLKESKSAWEKTREHALAFFSETYQISNIEAYEAMEKFDADVDILSIQATWKF